jgi:hypothetical protein
MATITFENVRNVTPYYGWDPRVLLGVNAVPNYSYASKANTIKSILEGTRSISTFVDDDFNWATPAAGEVRIRLHTARETAIARMRVNDFCFGTISQVSYADSHHQVCDYAHRSTVHIELDSWYFENYPLGYCTGMLCHEFAVHPLGFSSLNDRERRNEQDYRSGSKKGSEIGFKHLPRVKPSEAGQADHAFAAHPECVRYEIYQQTVLDVATTMQALVGQPAGPNQVAITANDVKDLFKCYLMDVASIQATNDHRARGIVKPGVLAQCYNTHRDLLLQQFHQPTDPLRALIPGPTNAGVVIKEFIYLLASIAWSVGPNWSKSWSGY